MCLQSVDGRYDSVWPTVYRFVTVLICTYLWPISSAFAFIEEQVVASTSRLYSVVIIAFGRYAKEQELV